MSSLKNTISMDEYVFTLTQFFRLTFHQAIFAIDRGGLNKILLDELEAMPNVKFFFNHKLTGADFNKRKAWFEVSGGKSLKYSVEIRDQEVEIDFDLLIGADGAHSAARYHMMKFARLDYQQVYIDTLWCEFNISAKELHVGDDEASRFRISPNHLHIWPGKDFMFIAIPSFVGVSPLNSTQH
jgi:kynurenine 3-monooxygenase